MIKFNIKSLEKTFNNIKNLSDDVNSKNKSIIKSTYKKYNNKSIETILSTLFMCFENDYKDASEEYYKAVNFFSETYLEGSEWYIGSEYTRSHHFNKLDIDTRYKFTAFVYFMLSIYIH